MKKMHVGIVGLLVAIVISGCGSQPPVQPKSNVTEKMGIINWETVSKAHPSYQKLIAVNKQVQDLTVNLQQAELLKSQQAAEGLLPNGASGIAATAEHEYNLRMTEKQRELNAELAGQASELEKQLSAEMNTYQQEIQQQYGLQIFNLQLKLKTVQMTTQEMEKIQQELQTLEKIRADKLAAKGQELSRRMAEKITPLQKAMETRLTEYSQKILTELKAKQQMQITEIQSRNQPNLLTAPNYEQASLEKQLDGLQAQSGELKAAIDQDIRRRTAQVATDKNLTVVITGIYQNVSATDITPDVVAMIKKQ